MKKEVSFLVCGILIGALIATCGFAWFLNSSKTTSAGSAGRLVLKLGHSLDTSHPVHQGMEFIEERHILRQVRVKKLLEFPDSQVPSRPLQK